jgi:hypothetical protein
MNNEWRDKPYCEWTRAKSKAGYGQKKLAGKLWYVHRLEWTNTYGEIPSGICVLHRCDNPACYEITHLFLGTHLENMRDMAEKGRSNQARKTHCPQGHPYSVENTYNRPIKPNRKCRECQKLRRTKKAELAAVYDQHTTGETP